MPIDLGLRPWWVEPWPEEEAKRAAEGLGLSDAEAKARLARFGPNLFRERHEKSLLLQYLTRFRNPLVIILLVASAVSAFSAPAKAVEFRGEVRKDTSNVASFAYADGINRKSQNSVGLEAIYKF